MSRAAAAHSALPCAHDYVPSCVHGACTLQIILACCEHLCNTCSLSQTAPEFLLHNGITHLTSISCKDHACPGTWQQPCEAYHLTGGGLHD